MVRRGLQSHWVGRRIENVTIHDVRSLRRHLPGAADFIARVTGRTVTEACRRGKYLWFPLDDGAAVLVHLGMSGQALITDPAAPPHRHTRITLDLAGGQQLRFVDQRIFGGMALSELDESGVPPEVAHIGLDPLDPKFDLADVVARVRRKSSGVKRILLDQTVASGIGNIYADEALWRSRLHYERSGQGLTRAKAIELYGHVTDVMSEALDQGGTSFDALYVNVNGESGYFSRSLNVYGREGEPCDRCGRPIVREPFMNRSSFRCPTCQRRPR